MTQTPEHSKNDKHLRGYHRLMAFLYELSHQPGKFDLTMALTQAKEKVVELKDLSHEEVEEIGQFILRDIESAASFFHHTSKELKSWLLFDLFLIEHTLLEMFLSVADKTKLALLNLDRQLNWDLEYHTGQIIGLGTLKCKNCNHRAHFHKPSHIPPCAHCRGTVFHRINDE